MNNTTQLHESLKAHGHSVTQPRIQVFETLQQTDEPLTVVELSERLTDIDKVSVYRTVDTFERLGIIHRVWNGFKSKVELSEPFSSHHHHFTCMKCGRTLSLKSEELEQTMRDFETTHGFILVKHSVELSGYCSDCKET